MKLKEIQNNILSEYHKLSTVQIKQGIQIIKDKGYCQKATGYICNMCLMQGRCSGVPTIMVQRVRKRLLKVMTEEELEQRLFDEML